MECCNKIFIMVMIFFLRANCADAPKESASEYDTKRYAEIESGVALDPETTPRFLEYVKRQPQELRDGERVWNGNAGTWVNSPICIMDLFYNTASGSATIAYTEHYEEGEANKERYVSFYDPENMQIIQTIIFDQKITRGRDLGGSFSENGQFFTVGMVSPLSESQSLYVYKKADKEYTQDVLDSIKIMPIPVLKIIQDYLNQRSYTLDRVTYHRPPLRLYLQLSSIVPQSFAYDSNDNTIACYGSPVSFDANPIRVFRTMIQVLQSGGALFTGSLIPVAILDAASKGSVKLIDSQRRCYVRHCIKRGVRALCTLSTNGQYIVYQDEDEEFYRLNRKTGERLLVPIRKIPEVLDNSGEKILENHWFSKEDIQSSNISLRIVSVINPKKVEHECIYPVRQSHFFGYSSKIYMDKNYCLTRSLQLIKDNDDCHIPAVVAIPSKKDDISQVTPPSLLDGKTGEMHPFQSRWLENTIPTLRQLQQDGAIIRGRVPLPTVSWYASVVPYVSGMVGVGGCIGVGWWLYNHPSLSARKKSSAIVIAGVGTAYFSHYMYQQASRGY